MLCEHGRPSSDTMLLCSARKPSSSGALTPCSASSVKNPRRAWVNAL
eukprot:CAMPEP_0171202436 /NCGR_PEP_ID=MMETSP0790-20130122/24999_1 /TAXON_ID=2925 /ORGANISM="Alexandrium catenella, Strain OF101" /LENGTH=46 /DNA_ID= /DNA_START= /DNA_END= /DNA_ORIENTATION=